MTSGAADRSADDLVQPPGERATDLRETEPAEALAVFGDRIGMARRYVELLATDGVLRGLVGPRETGRLWSRHVLNCASIAELIPSGATVVDVGSGAGLPGMVLAIARPDCALILLEPLERRVRFLDEAVASLGVPNAVVVRGRAQDAPGKARLADVVVSRAVAPLGKLAGWSAALARPGGLVLALKGSSAAAELERDRTELAAAGLRSVEVLPLDGPAGTTFVVRARKTGSGRQTGAGSRSRNGRTASPRRGARGPG